MMLLTSSVHRLSLPSVSFLNSIVVTRSCAFLSSSSRRSFSDSSHTLRSSLLPFPSRFSPSQLRRMSSSSSRPSSGDDIYDTYAKAPSNPSSSPLPPTPSSSSPLLQRPTPSNSIFFVCDIQETFRDKMHQWPLLVAASHFLTHLAHTLSIPIIVTEQKPFKPSINELTLSSIPHHLYSKSLFSMLTPDVLSHLRSTSDRRHVFVYGIEAHVCVMQTTLDLLREGYIVHLPLDSVTSMWEVDREAAMERYRGLQGEGLVLTSAESVFFELVADASKPEFKKCFPLVKEYAAVKRELALVKKKGDGESTASKL